MKSHRALDQGREFASASSIFGRDRFSLGGDPVPIGIVIAITLILTLQVSTLERVQAQSFNDLHRLANADDYVGARIEIKKLLATKLTYAQWIEIRRLAYTTPSVGYDLIFAIEKHPARKGFQDQDETEINRQLAQGEESMDAKDYLEAIRHFELAARRIRGVYSKKIPEENQQVYFYTLHQMARSLFALKRYKEALRIYDFFPRTYYQIRQTQFEKMWTAFYAERPDIAIGAIASQRSSYFSRFLDPETYLVQIYIFRKMCRYRELDSTLRELKLLTSLIKENRLPMKEWAKFDLETLSVYGLINPTRRKGRIVSLVNTEDRKSESAAITSTLTTQFIEDMNRLQSNYAKVLNYAVLSTKLSSKSLNKVAELPSPAVLSKEGFEYWPKKDSEEWLDELNTYFFIGDSKCGRAKSS